jgi:hypothetical protein
MRPCPDVSSWSAGRSFQHHVPMADSSGMVDVIGEAA